MNKDFAWGLFKNTGNVDAYLIMREVEENSELDLCLYPICGYISLSLLVFIKTSKS